MNLGKWITSKFERKGDFAAKIGADPTLISRWLRGAGISDEYQAKIRKLGYTGPWPAEEAQEALAPAGGPYATASEVAELRGALRAHVEQWERGTEKLLERLEALARKVDRLAEGGR